MHQPLKLGILLILRHTITALAGRASQDSGVPSIPLLPDDLWQEILFPENETIQHVHLVNPFQDTTHDGSVCIYVPEHKSVPKRNDTLNFHCARGHSQPCLNSGVCENKECERPGGLCVCPLGFQGVNCGIQEDQIGAAGCPLSCVHGVCVSDGKFPHCECEPGYTGGLCDLKAYHHECTAEGFHVCITPFSVNTYAGVMYVKTHRHDPECVLERVTYPPDPYDNIPDWCTGYMANIPFNSTCGQLGPHVNGDLTSYELVLLVQYAEDVITCTDEKVTLTCQFSKHSLLMYKTLYLDTGGLHDLPVVTETVDFVPAAMSMKADDGTSLKPPLPVGFKINVCIYTLEALGFEGIIINSILINNTRQGDDYRDMYLYHDGCVTETVNSILSIEPYWTSADKLEICFQFKVFFFDHDLKLKHPVLGLVIDVSTVTDAADAVKPTCGFRRKRQAVGEKETTLTSAIEITIEDTDVEIPSAKEEREWLKPVLYTVGAVAAVFIAVLVIVTVLMCRRPPMKVSRPDETKPMPKKFW